MSNSQSNSMISRTVLIAGSVAAVAVTGVAAYCSYKKMTAPAKGFNYYFELAEKKKKDGIECYRYKKYDEAMKFFKDAISAAKKIDTVTLSFFQLDAIKNLIANCNNNLSACCESLSNVTGAISYCNEAIKMNPKYVKSLKRRARLYEKTDQLVESIHDLFTLTALFTTQEDILALNTDIDRSVQKAVLPELDAIMAKSRNVHKKIPQYLVANWLWNTVIHDPIVNRCQRLKSNKAKNNGIDANGVTVDQSTLDDALILINDGKYDDVIIVVLKALNDVTERLPNLIMKAKELNVRKRKPETTDDEGENGEVQLERSEEAKEEDKNNSHLEKIQRELWEAACMLYVTARFIYFHNQTTAARLYVKRFDEIMQDIESLQLSNPDGWSKWNWTDLRVAHFTLLIAMAQTDDEAQKVANAAAAIAPTNTDPLLALACRRMDNGDQESTLNLVKKVVEINPEHPYATFYIFYLNYVIALKSEAIDRVRAHIYDFDQYLQTTDAPPFAQLLFVKVCINSENTDLAVSTLKKVVEAMPNNAYALYLFGIMSDVPAVVQQEPEKIRVYVNKVEKMMHKVIEIDPNYWEPYRTLAKIYLDKMQIDRALENYDKAMELARTRSDIESILKDQFSTRMIAERAKDGRGMPLIMPDAYFHSA